MLSAVYLNVMESLCSIKILYLLNLLTSNMITVTQITHTKIKTRGSLHD